MFLQQPIKLLFPLLALALLVVAPGCVVPKKYQPGKPFVLKTNINIQGNLPPDQKLDLKQRLENQLDDSLRVTEVTVFPLISRVNKPPVLDSSAILRSIGFMNNLLISQGFYNARIRWDTSIARGSLFHFIKVSPQEKPISVNFTVQTGKGYHFDSVGYSLEDSNLQAIALKGIRNTLIKKGMPYSADLIAAEFDRLVDLFRNQGYFKFSKDDLIAERDTIFAALINPNLDPFERLALLQEAKKRQENPTMNVVFRLKNPQNTGHFRKYFIRSVSVYPDLDLVSEDTLRPRFDSSNVTGIRIFSQYNKFKPKFVASQISLKPGELYRIRNERRTYGNFTQLNAWARTDIDIAESKDSSAMLDALVKLYPAKKQDISLSLDGSYNTGDQISTVNLFGIGLNLGLNDRNVAKQAIQASTNISPRIELGSNFIQTLQYSLSQTLNFPRFILPFKLRNLDSLRSQKTRLNFSASYTNRKDFYELRSLNVSWTYEWTKRRHTWAYTPFNVEYNKLYPQARLQALFDSIPNLKHSFNTGLVISQALFYNYSWIRLNKRNSFSIGMEESGGIFGFIRQLDQSGGLFRFVRFDADYRHSILYKKTSLAFRFYGGLGIPYGRDETGQREQQLPFFKSFYGRRDCWESVLPPSWIHLAVEPLTGSATSSWKEIWNTASDWAPCSG
jgi:outer membrane protein insertion porin family